MRTRTNIKIAVLCVVAALSMAVMGVLLYTMQSDLALQDYRQRIQQEMTELPDLLQTADTNAQQDTATYDEIFQSKAESVAFMAVHDAGFAATDEKMAELADLMNVDNLLVVDRAGTVLASAHETDALLSTARYNQLRSVFADGKPSAAVQVSLPDEGIDLRYWAARIDDGTMVVIEETPDELDATIAASGSVESVLKNITIGRDGYVFAVSAQDYAVEYHPNASLVGTDALDGGIDVTELEDGNLFWATFHGERLYCGVCAVGDSYYVVAVPESGMAESRTVTVGVILVVFFMALAVVIMYGGFVMHEHRRSEFKPENYRQFGAVGFNRVIGKKAAVLSFMGLLCIVVVTFYMQTLFALSAESVTNEECAAGVAETIERSADTTDSLTAQYNQRYLNKCQVAGYILDHNPALANPSDLQKLADVLQVQNVYAFDSLGNLLARNGANTKFALSDDPSEQSYEFRRLLDGAESVIQEPQFDGVHDDMRQYIGVPAHDAEGNVSGVIQLGIRTTRLENFLNSVTIDKVLSTARAGVNGFAFAVNRSDNTFAYFPDTRLVGSSALENGMTEQQLKGGFNDYLAVAGNTYYAASVETDDYYVYVVGTDSELMAERGPLTLATAGVAFVCLLVIFLLVSFGRLPQGTGAAGESEAGGAGADGKGAARDGAGADAASGEGARMIDVRMPSGRTAKTESAVSRWMDQSFRWNQKTAEQKTISVVRWLVGLMVVVVCVVVLFQDRIFDSGSIFTYILGGSWERGLNVFALTASIMFICVAATAVAVVRKVLGVLSSVLGARGETICRLISSFVKYATIIGMVYYSLVLIGVDGTTLLASAGILSIAISFGAKELVSDILSGLFIIFEGEFRVGDIIKVGDWRGTVLDIGVRTTKVKDGSGNVKVIRNSNVSNIINMTKDKSYASCDVGIEYGESLERVESILAKAFPAMREQLSAIVDGPFYKGVVSLGDNSVNIRIMAQCAEGDRVQLERDLNRRVKLLFDEHDISIPYPQVVVNQPVEFKKATYVEKRDAEKFTEEQKAVSKDATSDASAGR